MALSKLQSHLKQQNKAAPVASNITQLPPEIRRGLTWSMCRRKSGRFWPVLVGLFAASVAIRITVILIGGQ